MTTNNTAQMNYEYSAFVSYSHKDKKTAVKLQRAMEKYVIPTKIGLESPPKNLKVFRDDTDIPSGPVFRTLCKELDVSHKLVVLCSPNSANPESWVTKEIQHFIDLGRSEDIVPVIINGIPNDKSGNECFPQAILQMPDEEQPLAIDMQKMNFKDMLLRVIATLLEIKPDRLIERYKKQQKRRKRIITTIIAIIVSVYVSTVLYQNVQIKNQRNIALKNQSISLSDKSRQHNLSGDKTLGLLLALEALPENNNKPFIKEAQWALFESLISDFSGLETNDDREYFCGIDRYQKVGGSKWSIESEDKKLKFEFVYDGESKLYNYKTNEVGIIDKADLYGIMGTPLLPADNYPEYAFFSEDGEYLFISGNRGVMVIYLSDGIVAYKSDMGSYSADIGKNNKMLLYNGSQLLFVNLVTGNETELVHELPRGNTNTLMFSKDGNCLLSATERNELHIFALHTKQWESKLSVKSSNLLTAYFLSNNDVVLVYKDGSRRLVPNSSVSAGTGNHLPASTVSGEHYNSVTQLVTSIEKNWVCVKYGESSIRVYDAGTMNVLYELPNDGNVQRIISNDGRYICERKNTQITVIDIESKQKEQYSFDSLPEIVALFSNQYILVHTSSVTTYDEKSRVLAQDDEKGNIINLKSSKIVLESAVYRNNLQKTDLFTSIKNVKSHEKTEFAFSRDGKYYFNGKGVFEIETNKSIVQNLTEDKILIAGFTQSNYGFYVVYEDKSEFYLIKDGKAQLLAQPQALPTVISANCRFAVGFKNDIGYVYDTATQKQICELVRPQEWYNIEPLSINGSTIDGYLAQGVFLEDERILAMLSKNGHILFWDFDNGNFLSEVIPSTGKYTDIQLLNSKIVMQSSENIKVASYRLDVIIKQAREVLNGRTLTLNERKMNYCENQ